MIEILPVWHEVVAPGLEPGKSCFYVGETGKRIRERFREHRTGKADEGKRLKPPVKVFRKIFAANGGTELRDGRDVLLRHDINRNYRPVKTKADADALEAAVITELRKEGHVVYPKSRGA